jgi:hypothetical protein
MLLGKEDILKVQDLKFEDVDVPEWGGTVRVKTMTGTERESFEQDIVGDGKRNLQNIRAKFLARIICDDNGNRLFGDDEIKVLGKKSVAALDRLFETGQRLNRLGKSDLDELAKNSEGGVSDTSISPSPAN